MNNIFGTPVSYEPILREVFTGWKTGNGIFNYLETVADMPWKDDENVTSDILNLEYFGNHSGAKFCSPVVKTLIEDETLDSVSRTALANIIVAKFIRNWNVLWQTNVVDYNPIHNYDMVENRVKKGAASRAEVGHDVVADTGTDTQQYGKVETTQHGMTNQSLESIYGINTQDNDPRPSSKTNNEEGGSTVLTNSGSDVETKNLARTTDNSVNSVDATEEEEELHRSGNIGVTTSQQMLEAERKLRTWNFFDQIFNDIDSVLALAIFDPCRV